MNNNDDTNKLQTQVGAEPSVPLPVRTPRSALSLSESDRSVASVGTPEHSSTETPSRWLASLTREQLKLRNSLLLAYEQDEVRSVMITGTSHGTGVTSIAAVLALGLSSSAGKEVLLIDGNALRPQLKSFHSRSPASEARANDAYFEAAAVSGASGLKVAPPHEPATGSLDEKECLAASMPELRQRFDFIIIDAPPVSLHPDMLALSARLDRVILVAEAERTPIQELQEAVELLNRAQARLLGVVLNRERQDLPRVLENWL